MDPITKLTGFYTSLVNDFNELTKSPNTCSDQSIANKCADCILEIIKGDFFLTEQINASKGNTKSITIYNDKHYFLTMLFAYRFKMVSSHITVDDSNKINDFFAKNQKAFSDETIIKQAGESLQSFCADQTQDTNFNKFMLSLCSQENAMELFNSKADSTISFLTRIYPGVEFDLKYVYRNAIIPILLLRLHYFTEMHNVLHANNDVSSCANNADGVCAKFLKSFTKYDDNVNQGRNASNINLSNKLTHDFLSQVTCEYASQHSATVIKRKEKDTSGINDVYNVSSLTDGK
jgi:hypothetical protein